MCTFQWQPPTPPLPATNPPPSAAPSNRVTDKTMNNENWLHILCEIVSSKLDLFLFFSVWPGQSSIILRLNSRMKSEIKRHAGQIRASIGLYPKSKCFHLLMKCEIKRHAGQIRASMGLYPKAKVNCGRQYKLGTVLVRKPDKCSATLGQTMYLLQFMQPGRYSGTTAPI